MALISLQFILFCAALLAVYYLVPKKLQNLCLLAGNLAFLAAYNAARITVTFLGLSIVTTWAGAVLLDKISAQIAASASAASTATGAESAASTAAGQNVSTPGQAKKSLLASQTTRGLIFGLTIFLNLIFLFYFKFSNSVIFAFNGLGIWSREAVQIAAPLGISFYTLQLLGYLIDVYNGKIPAEKNLFRYAIFGSYFPPITSGPIVRYEELRHQLTKPRYFDYRQVTFGVQRMLWGFFKKLVISERAAVVANTVFGNYQVYSGFYIIVGVVIFAVQLYTDFSGCMDIILGMSQALGLALPENFLTPFYSRSETEFWRRWHITLGTWFKDYVFYPIQKTEIFYRLREWSKKTFGKKKGKKLPMYVSMFILWFGVGFWHGGLWKYIVGSGLIHFVYIVLGQELEPVWKKLNRILHVHEGSKGHILFQRIRTFLLVCSGFMFFRADSFHTALKMYRAIGTFDLSVFSMQGLTGLGLDIYDLLVLTLAIILMALVEHRQQTEDVRDAIARQEIYVRWLIYIGLFFVVVIYGMYGANYNAASFIYANF